MIRVSSSLERVPGSYHLATSLLRHCCAVLNLGLPLTTLVYKHGHIGHFQHLTITLCDTCLQADIERPIVNNTGRDHASWASLAWRLDHQTSRMARLEGPAVSANISFLFRGCPPLEGEDSSTHHSYVSANCQFHGVVSCALAMLLTPDASKSTETRDTGGVRDSLCQLKPGT